MSDSGIPDGLATLIAAALIVLFAAVALFYEDRNPRPRS